MSVARISPPLSLEPTAGTTARLIAFARRDLLVMLSYRLALFTDWFSLLIQVLVFSFIGKLIDPQSLPTIDGEQPTYLEFVAVGVALSSFISIGLIRIVRVMREEQMMGTLESLMLTPTSIGTVLIGSVFYDVIYVPLRTTVFFLLMWAFFDFGLNPSGLVPAVAILIAFIPFIWGLGITSAAAVFTFRRGAGVMGIAGTLLTIGSGSYFPLTVLPDWIADLAEHNPIAVTLQALRAALIGDAGWSAFFDTLPVLIPWAVLSIALGAIAFKAALARERRLGTIGAY